MANLIDLAPQIGVALAILAAALIINRQINRQVQTMAASMADALVGQDKNGEKKSRLQIIEEQVADHGKKLEEHKSLQNKQWNALRVIQQNLYDVMEFVTGSDSNREAELPDDIDNMPTGRFEIPGHVRNGTGDKPS